MVHRSNDILTREEITDDVTNVMSVLEDYFIKTHPDMQRIIALRDAADLMVVMMHKIKAAASRLNR